MAIVPCVGQKYGKLTVLEDVGRQQVSGSVRHCVRVLCECGNEKIVRSSFLTNGKTKSCGCLVGAACSDRNKANSIPVCVGDKFGKLTVLENLGQQSFGSYAKEVVRVRCDCGTEKVVRSHTLKNGGTVSCGCSKQESQKAFRSVLQIGEKYGKLTILENLGVVLVGKPRKSHVRVRCDCGVEKTLMTVLVKRGHTQSCGCSVRSGDNHRTHDGSKTRIYRIWTLMKERCDRSNNPGYGNYGGRGISICSEWYDFVMFRDWAEKNGYGETLSIDRIDNDGNYEPSNCQWVTSTVQARNTRANINLTAFGETKTAAEWARDSRCSIGKGSLIARVRRGIPHEEAITKPPWLAPR